MSQSPEDKAFTEAMVAIAHWHAANPKAEGPESEPPEISAQRKIVMNRVAALREGDLDPWMGKTIKVLVRKSTRYIVYIDEDLEVQWWWTTRLLQGVDTSIIQANVMRLTYASNFLLDKSSDLRWGCWAKIWDNSPILKFLCPSKEPGVSRMQQEINKSFLTAQGIRMLIAESMSMVLNNVKKEDCEKVQQLAEEQILVTKDQVCRSVFFWEFVGALLFLLLLVFFAKVSGTYWLVEVPGVRWFQAATAGAFGALLFSISRTRSLNLEPDSGRKGLRMEAYSRALIGAGAGILVHFAFEAGLIVKAALGDDKDVRDSVHAFLCIASGWSERILPSLLQRAEGLVAGTEGKGK